MASSISSIPLSKRSSITKRGLSLRKASRGSARSARSSALTTRVASHQPRRSAARSEHYTQRVLAGEFEPTALRARAIAADLGISLHELAHRLRYAAAPPATRSKPQLSSIPRSELASATGYHISDISRLFARKHPPTLTKLARVAAVYGAWMDDVLTAIGW